MEIVVCALKIEEKILQSYFKNHTNLNLKFVNCGVKAKNLEFIKHLGSNDHITNIGICAGNNIGDIFLVNKIKYDKDYYPDILHNKHLNCKTLITVKKPASSQLINKKPDMLYDMEAALIFKEASKYIGPHQISFLKIVSDSGCDNTKINIETINNVLNANLQKIYKFIIQTENIFNLCENNNPSIEYREYYKILKCSLQMEQKLNELFRYAEICNINVNKYLNEEISKRKLITKNDSLQIIKNLESYMIKQ